MDDLADPDEAPTPRGSHRRLSALTVIGVLLLVAPDAIPGLTIPGGGAMDQMEPMGS